ncbi:MAG: hypothetical protein ABIP33_09925, partial [Pseudolysinimonas sp.]
LQLPHALSNPDIIDDHELIVAALERGNAREGEEVIRRHAYRIIADSEHIRASHPEYFEP